MKPSQFSLFWSHLCNKCGERFLRIHRHHVSYFPEFVVPLCPSCHLGLTQFPESEKSYLIRYTKEECREFYGLNLRGISNASMKRAAAFFQRKGMVSQKKAVARGFSPLESAENFKDFWRLAEIESIFSVSIPRIRRSFEDSLRFNHTLIFDIGQLDWLEPDEEHRARYGSPFARLVIFMDFGETTGELRWTKPGHYAYDDKIYLTGLNPLLRAAIEATDGDPFKKVRRLLFDLES